MSLRQGVSVHPDVIRLVGDVDCSVHHIWKFGDGIQGRGEKLDLLYSWHVGVRKTTPGCISSL
jgi:hypothetical protein